MFFKFRPNPQAYGSWKSSWLAICKANVFGHFIFFLLSYFIFQGLDTTKLISFHDAQIFFFIKPYVYFLREFGPRNKAIHYIQNVKMSKKILFVDSTVNFDTTNLDVPLSYGAILKKYLKGELKELEEVIEETTPHVFNFPN